MKDNFIAIRTLLAAFLVFVLLFWLLWCVFGPEPEVRQREVSVIVSGSNNERWLSVSEGMEQAAIDNNLLLNIVSTNQYMSVNDQWDLIDNEVRNGADAIIFDPVGSIGFEEKLAGLLSIPIVLLTSDIEPANTYPGIHADNYKLGQRIANVLYHDYGEKLKDMKIGIISAPCCQTAVEERKQGLADGLKAVGTKYAWSFGLGRNLEHSLENQLKRTKTDIVVALGDLETEIAIDVVLKNQEDVAIYGEGYSEKNIYYLDNGLIDCLVMSNEYYIGYYSVAMAADQLNHGKMKFDPEQIEIYTLHRNDLYLEDIQKIVFPVIQ